MARIKKDVKPVRLTTEERRKLLSDKAKAQSQKITVKKDGTPRKPYTRKPAAQDPPTPPVQDPPAPPAQDPPAPPAQDPPAPPAPDVAADIMAEIDAAFETHREAIKDTLPQNQPATPPVQNNPPPATPGANVPGAATIAQATNEANEALSRLVDPELIILAFDLFVSSVAAGVLRKFAKFDVKARDFQFTSSERNDLGKLLSAYMKTRQKSMLSPGWALLMGVAGVYAGKGINMIGAKKIVPPAPAPPVQQQQNNEGQMFHVRDPYMQQIHQQNDELIKTLSAMQREIEGLKKRTTSQNRKRTGNQNGRRKKRGQTDTPGDFKTDIIKLHGNGNG